MPKKHRWLWILLFAFVLILLIVLATGWNVVLVRDYQHIVQLATKLSIQEGTIASLRVPLKMVLGTLGFIATLAITILIFIKLLREMHLNQQQSEFLATISHELKTPIAAMELTSSLIRTGEIEQDEIKALWNSHQTELNRLKEQVYALLEAARWQTRAPLYRKEKVSLELWIQESWAQWKTALGPKALLTREGGPLHASTILDASSLNLIVDNLLSNAKKFCKDYPQVTLRTLTFKKSFGPFFKKQYWQIEVEDQGWGFDPSSEKKIFRRFFRLPTSAPYAIAGTGLGLYLARSAGNAMGLRLKARGRGEGKGAIFTLSGRIKSESV